MEVRRSGGIVVGVATWGFRGMEVWSSRGALRTWGSGGLEA